MICGRRTRCRGRIYSKSRRPPRSSCRRARDVATHGKTFSKPSRSGEMPCGQKIQLRAGFTFFIDKAHEVRALHM